MHRAAAAIVLALTLLAGCRARTSAQTPSPASAPSTAEAALELQRVLGSEHGDAILAYEGGAPEGHRSHLCVLRVTDRSVRCMVPAAVASDIPGGFDIVGISPSLRYFALRLADQLRIYETGALQVVATVPLADGAIGPVDFDPGETRSTMFSSNGRGRGCSSLQVTRACATDGARSSAAISGGRRSPRPTALATSCGSAATTSCALTPARTA